MFFRFIAHSSAFLALTILTQLGGLAWLFSLIFKRRLLAFLVLYVALSLSALFIAPSFGRVPISCVSDGPLQVQSPVYCALNRTYVTPELLNAIESVAAEMAERHEGTVTIVLDGSFPFLDGFPMLPHLSHDDGEKIDFAFFYEKNGAYLPGATRSPIGFFAFEDGPTDCPSRRLTLRWDLDWLQPLWADYELDEERLRDLVQLLAEHSSIDKVLLEPHLTQRLGIRSAKVRFQGCRAARHDDHIHVQL